MHSKFLDLASVSVECTIKVAVMSPAEEICLDIEVHDLTPYILHHELNMLTHICLYV
jgi:hypothetical protein